MTCGYATAVWVCTQGNKYGYVLNAPRRIMDFNVTVQFESELICTKNSVRHCLIVLQFSLIRSYYFRELNSSVKIIIVKLV